MDASSQRQIQGFIDDIDLVTGQIDDFRTLEREAANKLMECQAKVMSHDEYLTHSDEE